MTITGWRLGRIFIGKAQGLNKNAPSLEFGCSSLAFLRNGKKKME
jgi:hypothetical protein